LGQAALIGGGPQHVNTDLATLQRITAADVHRVLQKYVTGAHSVTIDYLPEAAKSAPAAARGEAK
jgi:zinc protease